MTQVHLMCPQHACWPLVVSSNDETPPKRPRPPPPKRFSHRDIPGAMGLDSTTSASFFGHFDRLEDPRIERCQRHNLCDILFLAVCAMIAGANDFVAMQKFGHAKWGWLKKFLELPN